VSDEATIWLSKDIAKRIENELEYPGQIKVTVIRETRSVEYARGTSSSSATWSAHPAAGRSSGVCFLSSTGARSTSRS
jgi:hypothetical protein